MRKLAAALPDVDDGTTYGTPALKVGGRMFACLANHKSAEPNTLVLSLGFERRDELLDADPEIYYLKEHYVNYPLVLVRLARVHPDALSDLLRMAWRFTSAKRPRKSTAKSLPLTPALSPGGRGGQP